jgi:hypothetical protein
MSMYGKGEAWSSQNAVEAYFENRPACINCRIEAMNNAYSLHKKTVSDQAESFCKTPSREQLQAIVDGWMLIESEHESWYRRIVVAASRLTAQPSRVVSIRVNNAAFGRNPKVSVDSEQTMEWVGEDYYLSHQGEFYKRNDLTISPGTSTSVQVVLTDGMKPSARHRRAYTDVAINADGRTYREVPEAWIVSSALSRIDPDMNTCHAIARKMLARLSITSG